MKNMIKKKCTICGWIYDPESEKSAQTANVALDTPFEELSDDWSCPYCSSSQDNFKIVK
jgi:rubredoxin